MQRCWGCCWVRPVLPMASPRDPGWCQTTGHSHLAVGALAMGSCRSPAMIRGTHHKEGGVAAGNTDRNPVTEGGQDPAAEGRGEVDCCNLGTRMVGEGMALAVGATCWETH